MLPLEKETCINFCQKFLYLNLTLHCTSQLRICDIHRNIIIETTNKRYRRQNFGVPSVNVILKYHNTTKAVDRHVTPEMFQRIVTKTGIFIPIGTSICRLCREKLFGNNSIEHVEEALDKVPGKRYRVKVVDTILDLDVTKKKETITNITRKLVTLKSTKNSVQLKILNDWTEMSFNDLITEGTEQASKQQKQTFIYSMDGCIQEFKNQISLDQHLLQGSCEYKLEKGPLKDQAKVLYAQKLSNNVHHCPDMQAVLLENACTTDLSAKEM
ncbi:unnamed protein product [Mytilus coruscus]|uniref:Uncharacterized protein n=1 Tax=Mytilus coruscus TaxID=42192 RepID=A0A6J8B9Z7_MYTCO|nr:unnamed protein product [Mytilus coruscus]